MAYTKSAKTPRLLQKPITNLRARAKMIHTMQMLNSQSNYEVRIRMRGGVLQARWASVSAPGGEIRGARMGADLVLVSLLMLIAG